VSKTLNPAKEPHGQWITLLLLALLYGLSVADRLLMSVFIEPIKAEFHLSDANVGFLTGAVFAIFFVGASVPLGILSDRGSRRNLVAMAAALFSVATSLAGIAKSYWLLLVSRMCVGVGEAGFIPTSVAMLADRFVPARRPTVMSLYALGGTLGAWAGISGAGYLESRYSWRTTMLVFGAIGVPIMLLIMLLVKEPGRASLDGRAEKAAEEGASFSAVLRMCRTQKSVLHTLIAANVISFWVWGLVWWAPALLQRSFGITTGEAGALIGPIHGVVGTISVLAASALLIPLGKGDPRKPLWFLAIFGVATALPSIYALFAQTLRATVAMIWLFLPMAYVFIGPVFALISSGVPQNMRGQASALLVATTNFSTLAVAPVAVGVLSDLLGPHLVKSADSLRWALLPLALSGFWAIAHLLIAGRYIQSDLARLESIHGNFNTANFRARLGLRA